MFFILKVLLGQALTCLTFYFAQALVLRIVQLGVVVFSRFGVHCD